MEFVHLYVFALGALATTLLALEKAHLSVLGVMLIVGVALPGIVHVRDAVAGFSNTAVITVAALYVVGEAFLRTGAASVLANRILRRVGGGELPVAAAIMAIAAALSAFVNNILVVVTFLPVVTSICRRTGLPPSRLLIPLSFASILGGMCTLVGTSTNLLVSGTLAESGRPPIGMFELTGPGLVLASIGLLYTLFVARRGLPRVSTLAGQISSAALQEYVTEITVGRESPWIGTKIEQLGLRAAPEETRPGTSDEASERNSTEDETDESGEQPAPLPSPRARVSMLVRDEVVYRAPFGGLEIAAGDILVVNGRVQDLAHLHGGAPAGKGAVEVAHDERYDPATMSFFELAMTPSSAMLGRRVRDLELKRIYGSVVVGVMRDGSHHQQRFADLRLRTGDVLLAFGDDRARQALRSGSGGGLDFHLIEGVDEVIYRREKAGTAALVLLGVVLGFTFLGDYVHPATVALCGALGMVLTGCLNVRQANQAVNWPIITFIAGTIALSKALQETGADRMLGSFLADSFGGYGGVALLAAMYLGTVILTEFLSNNAVAVLMTPVAVATAQAAGIEPRSLVLAVCFAASTSFANPSAYKTNLMVYGPGGYRFRDFFVAGIGLDLVLIVAGLIVLPFFLPL
jgi:di/tricarboxylate transporter